MFPILAILFIGVPLAEIAVLIWVGGHIGAPETIALLVLVSLVGAWLAKRQGLGVLAKIRAEMEYGHLPGRELVDGLLILVGAVLLLTPGFITDAVALGLLVPPVRAGLRGVARYAIARKFMVRVWGDSSPPRRPPAYGRNEPRTWEHPPDGGPPELR